MQSFELLIIVGILIGFWIYVLKWFYDGHKVENKQYLSGQEIAKKIIDSNKLENVYIVSEPRFGKDNYAWKRKTIRLNKQNFQEESQSAYIIGIYIALLAISDTKAKGKIIINLINFAGMLSYVYILGLLFSFRIYDKEFRLIMILLEVIMGIIGLISYVYLKKESEILLEELEENEKEKSIVLEGLNLLCLSNFLIIIKPILDLFYELKYRGNF